jgi:hypothetical protein
MVRLTALAAWGIALPQLALAHPGHGLESGIVHFLTDPFHLGTALVIAIVAMVAFRFRRVAERSRSREPRS